MGTASFPHAEHVGCPAATIDGIPVESAIFGETIEVPCPPGRHEGVMNVTCSATGVWETPATLCRGSLRGVSSLVPYTCAEETVEGISWPLTNAGTQATVSCVLKNPQLRGNITRECSIAGEWGTPAEACYSGAPKDFAYAVSVVTVPRQVEIPAMTPVPIAGVERFEAVDALPFGLEIDAATGVISGAPLQVAASRSYRIVAKNAQGSGGDTGDRHGAGQYLSRRRRVARRLQRTGAEDQVSLPGQGVKEVRARPEDQHGAVGEGEQPVRHDGPDRSCRGRGRGADSRFAYCFEKVSSCQRSDA